MLLVGIGYGIREDAGQITRSGHGSAMAVAGHAASDLRSRQPFSESIPQGRVPATEAAQPVKEDAMIKQFWTPPGMRSPGELQWWEECHLPARVLYNRLKKGLRKPIPTQSTKRYVAR